MTSVVVCTAVPQGKLDAAALSRDELRKLFELRESASDTHDGLRCRRSDEGCHRWRRRARAFSSMVPAVRKR